ncbi:MAG: DUF882 domain-containing protein [Methylophilaceae bacterium]
MKEQDELLLPALSRRGFLKMSAAAMLAAAVPGQALAAMSNEPERKLSFYHLHTGEKLSAVYWADGAYQQDSLADIYHVLRDFRSGDVSPIDTGLLDLLHSLSMRLDTTAEFQVVSGYRSPTTNAMLAKNSSGVARHSLHMDGLAIDIRLPGRDLAKVHRAALALKGGGVGYYPVSDFVHMDVGRVRQWTGA